MQSPMLSTKLDHSIFRAFTILHFKSFVSKLSESESVCKWQVVSDLVDVVDLVESHLAFGIAGVPVAVVDVDGTGGVSGGDVSRIRLLDIMGVVFDDVAASEL